MPRNMWRTAPVWSGGEHHHAPLDSQPKRHAGRVFAPIITGSPILKREEHRQALVLPQSVVINDISWAPTVLLIQQAPK